MQCTNVIKTRETFVGSREFVSFQQLSFALVHYDDDTRFVLVVQ